MSFKLCPSSHLPKKLLLKKVMTGHQGMLKIRVSTHIASIKKTKAI